tara:strand:- start:112 stop:423 length:312 start_codon:yes stop_codon:yes gene_type:complete
VFTILMRIHQLVKMYDKVAHMGIIDGPLGGTFPRLMRGGVIWKNADKIHTLQVTEINTLQILKLATKDEMQQLFVSHMFVTHGVSSKDGDISSAEYAVPVKGA